MARVIYRCDGCLVKYNTPPKFKMRVGEGVPRDYVLDFCSTSCMEDWAERHGGMKKDG